MAGTTQQNLQYTTSGDVLAAAAAAVQKLAEQVDARLDSHDVDLATSIAPPMTVVERRTIGPEVLRGVNGTLVFDTVLADNQGGADLTADARIIRMKRTGYWMIGGYLQVQNPPNTSAVTGVLNIVAQGGVSFGNVYQSQYAGSDQMFLSCSTVCRVSDADRANLSMFFEAYGSFTGASTTCTPITRVMWAYWMGDL